MPDPLVIMMSVAVAALLAAAVVLASAWAGRANRAPWMAVGAVLGVASGFYLGCWMLEVRPSWPPREDQDRLLFLVMPAVIAVEVLASLAGRRSVLTWTLRAVVAAGASRVLLHDTIYLTDLAGPGSREWNTGETWFILGAMALLLAGVWLALAMLVQRAPGRSIPVSVALTIAASAVTVMLSGYASGGQLGLPLAAALVGAILATFASLKLVPAHEPLGVGVVGLFALLVLGRFFGGLGSDLALLLFLTPLSCWLSELPYVRRLSPRLRGVLRLAFTAIPVAIALVVAQQRFTQDSAPAATGQRGPSVQDYLDYGR